VDPATRPRPRIRGILAWPFVLAVGLVLGVYEGLIYAPPHGHEYVVWSLLLVMEALLLFGWLGPARGLAFLPLVIVAQDVSSLVAQGASPFTADWYRLYFGDNLLTRRDVGFPNWYVVGVFLTVVADLALALPRRVAYTPSRSG